MSSPDPIRRYTVQDYLSWPDDVRCELIHGQVYDMTPAPSLDHQDVVLSLGSALQAAAGEGGSGPAGHPCRVFVAPVDVVLSRDTVVQPDVVVVCAPAKTADRQRIQGAPDLVVEVLSPSTSLKDRREKRALYEAHGVPEYLIVDPAERYAEYFRSGVDGRYGPSTILGPEDDLRLVCLPELRATLTGLLGWPVATVQEPAPAYDR
jgi:Uma2 family endonuclease